MMFYEIQISEKFNNIEDLVHKIRADYKENISSI